MTENPEALEIRKIAYDDCTVGANEPLDKYTINRVFRRCYDAAQDRIDRLLKMRENPPHVASEDSVGLVRFVDSYVDANQRALSPAHVMNLSSFAQYSDRVVNVSDKCIANVLGADDAVTVYTSLNDTSVNTMPNGMKVLTGSFVVGFNHIDLDRLLATSGFVDMDGSDMKDSFYTTKLRTGEAVTYVPYIDRARMDEYALDPLENYSGRVELSENVFERRMKAIRVASDIGGERNRYIVESLFNFSFSIQDFVSYCDLVDMNSEPGEKRGEVELDESRTSDYPGRFYFYRRPLIMVQAVDVSPGFNRFNRTERDGKPEDLEEPICSGVDGSVYVPPRNTAFVENFSCDYDIGEGSDYAGGIVNNTLTIGLSSRFVIGDDRDNVGYASASKLNHKVKVTFMLMGV